MQILGDLFKSLDVTVSTPWREAHNMILSSSEFKADPELQKIESIDILGVYDDYSRQLEQEHEEESRKARIEHVRKARKAREGFKALLSEYEHKGELTRNTKWKDFAPLIRKDERYRALLGQPGSSPVELWMDAVDDIAEEVESTADKIQMALGKDKSVLLETSLEQFEAMCKDAQLEKQFDEKRRKDAFDLVSILRRTG